jgi:hypothetical protein
MKTCLFAIAIVATIGGAYLSAYPEPAIVPADSDWTLEVLFNQPEQIIMKMPGNGEKKRFWYIILTLTNNSSKGEVPFYPSCNLMTDTFRITPSGKTVTKQVFEKIKLRHQGKYPLLENLEKVNNKILQGKDNTMDIAIIWPDFDAGAKNITMFIEGMSNETTAIDHPTDAGTKVFLRKTLALSYAIGGDPKLRSRAKLAYKSKRWVMR